MKKEIVALLDEINPKYLIHILRIVKAYADKK